ncbi:mobile mystery protein B [Ewingella americana]|uniref:mobile mystery protein B n=1 Tax=Ewingella americana TaxID=41202 RepID=UPI0012AD37C8|nr:mobile mystery protein B [Ewingella americana]MRT02432.1 mobile mystery protein B [Ewingella americana]
MSERINAGLPEGATELSPDDLVGLIPDYIDSREDLNQFEKLNIQHALHWLSRKKLSYKEILTVDFCIQLHRKMFDKTWEWAGQLRRREVNIGNTPPYMISMRVRDTLDNVAFWIENDTYPPDEICLRLHREIVWIPPFPNGNGRHSRIFCDVLRSALGERFFAWGASAGELVSASQHRAEYITALREADVGDYRRLIRFAVSGH